MSQTTTPPKKSKAGLIIGLLLVLLLVVGGGALAVVGLTGAAGAGAWFYMASADSAGPVAETSVVIADDARQNEAPNEPSNLAEADAEVSASPHSPAASDPILTVDGGAAVAKPRPAPIANAPVDPVNDALGDLPSGDDAGADSALDQILGDEVAIKIIHTNPGVAVTIDGAAAGMTPLKIEVASGSHQLQIRDGKATGAFNIAAGAMQEKWCFESKGKKVEAVGC